MRSLCYADSPFSGGEIFWGHTNSFPCSPITALEELLSLTLPEEEYSLFKSELFPLEDSLQRQCLILAAPQEVTRTAWQCSFYQMPRQPFSWSLGQFGDPKLPSLVDWNPLKRGKPRAGFSGNHISSK